VPKIYKRKCNICGKQYKGRGKEFCSRECYNKSDNLKIRLRKMWEKTRGSIPWNKQEKIKKNCLFCNKEYFILPRKKNRSKYCSQSCKAKYLVANGTLKQTRFEKGLIPWNKDTKGVCKAWNKGRKFPEFSGANSASWRGGKSDLYEQIRKCLDYKQWRTSVFERDNYTCQGCGQEKSGNIVAHHKNPFIVIIRKHNIKTLEGAINCNELWDTKNGITLCVKCHKFEHHNEEIII